MCLHYWTFPVINAEKISCTNDCVLRWVWVATHLSVTSPERFENCQDITLSVGSNGGSSNNPPTIPVSVPANIPHSVAHTAPQTQYQPQTSVSTHPYETKSVPTHETCTIIFKKIDSSF